MQMRPLEGLSSICLTTAYLAPVEYYSAIANADEIYLENCDYYTKQTYRNRCHIAAANGVMALTIPVEKSGSDKILTKDVRISAHNDWQNQHWRSIESAYNSSPFFEYYKDDLMPLYEKKWSFLWDFNWELHQKIMELLELEKEIQFTTKYQHELVSGTMDLRESIHPKKPNLQNKTTPYYQVFEQKLGFKSNLSIIDLLFNMGNESQLIINELQ